MPNVGFMVMRPALVWLQETDSEPWYRGGGWCLARDERRPEDSDHRGGPVGKVT
jgi:hypothetical protein